MLYVPDTPLLQQGLGVFLPVAVDDNLNRRNALVVDAFRQCDPILPLLALGKYKLCLEVLSGT